MTLLQALDQLLGEDDLYTVFAKRPWSADADAVIAKLTETNATPPELTAAGYTYFLEADVAREILEGRTGELLSRDQALSLLLYYGEFDGFPDWANTLLAF